MEKKKQQGYFSTEKNSEVCERNNDAIVICVKPQMVEEVCKDIAAIKSNSLIISVLAGVTLQTLEKLLPGRRVIRVMPNTACLVGESASCFAMGILANDSDRALVETIFGSVGLILEQKEVNLGPVTGLSGSGPAFVFQFIEALADGGVFVGLSRQDALLLAAQTCKGAAEMVLKTGSNPSVLKDQGKRTMVLLSKKRNPY
jgi:pyrroline-5-carboxylate reductase